MAMILYLSWVMQSVEAKRKKKTGGLKTCADIGLDCSKTCCLVDRCAPTYTDELCSGYNTRPFIELYVGLGILIGLVFGIPIIVKVVNFLVLYKFC